MDDSTFITIVVVAWLAIAAVTAAIASDKGRDPVGWFLVAAILSPLALLFALIASPIEKPSEVPVQETTKTCPDCAETVRQMARICRYCGHRFVDGSALEPDIGPQQQMGRRAPPPIGGEIKIGGEREGVDLRPGPSGGGRDGGVLGSPI